MNTRSFPKYTGIFQESSIFWKVNFTSVTSLGNFLAMYVEEKEDKRKCPEHLLKGECTKALLPVNDALDVLSGKWKLPIIISLTFGKKRFKQIQNEIPGITPKMLSKELKDLEMNELIKRQVYDTQPVSIEYEITTYGKTLNPLISELHEWGTKHRKRMIAREPKRK